MQKINKFLLKYLIFAVPFILLLFACGMIPGLQAIVRQVKGLSVVTDILTWILISWFVVLIFVLAELLLYQDMRSSFFAAAARLAGIKERDERESRAIDKAGRYAYISTLSLMVCLLFFYSINVTVDKLPPEKWVEGKHKTLTIGFGIALTDNKPAVRPEDAYKIFSNWDIPISKQSLIALMIAWHLISFLFYLRRTNKYS
jgi:hypothetical protein